MISTSIIAFILMAISCRAQICDDTRYSLKDTDPPLPDLPDQFSYSIEAVLVERNTSIFMTEYFDEIGNRGRLDFTTQGRTLSVISDYQLNESFVFPNTRTGDECTVSIISNSSTRSITSFFFGVVYNDDGTVHIGAPSMQLYRRINETKTNYIGLNMTRGIPVYHWQSCVVENENLSFVLDYYFSHSDLWSNGNNVSGYIPVSIELRAERFNTMSQEWIDVEHYYTFLNYKTGSAAVPDDVFMQPTGLICLGRLPGKPLPPFPSFFIATIEQSVDTFNNVTIFKEYYDLKHNLFGIEGYSNSSFFTGSYSVVQDFNTELVYFNPYHVLESCTASRIDYEQFQFDANRDVNGHLHLKTLKELLYAEDFRKFVYEGATIVRGVEVDVWIAHNLSTIQTGNSTFTDLRYQVYFTRPGTRTSSLYGEFSDPVLLQTTFSGVWNISGTVEPFKSVSSFIGFSPIEPYIDVFDISQCISDNESRDVRFRLPINATYINEDKLKQNIRSAVSQYASSIGMPLVTPLQISSVRIGINSENQSIYVHLHVSNVSRNSSTKWNYTANALVDKILGKLNNGDPLPFRIPFRNSNVTPYYLVRGPSNNNSSQDDDDGDFDDLSVGAITGIAIGNFVFGLLVGAIFAAIIAAIVTFVCVKGSPRNSATFSSAGFSGDGKYDRHFDDMAADT